MKEIIAALYRLRESRAAVLAPHMEVALAYAECDSKQRVACFLAQVGHESGGLRYNLEIWGPTAQQLRYEGTKLAERLGNVQVGDGRRYMGRGWIQLTGRANYARLSKVFGIDLISNPETLESPKYAALSAAEFWKSRKLNSYADSYDFVGLTKRINGGLNGLAHRQALYTKALMLC